MARNIRQVVLMVAAAAALGVMDVGSVSGATIYFADIFNPDFEAGSIRRMESDGSGLVTLVDTGGGLRGLAVDTTGGKLYWSDVNVPVIRRANLDGSDVEDIVTTNLEFPSAIALDLTNGKLYWGNQSDKNGAIWRANLDGSGIEFVLATAFHRGLEVEPATGKLYWTTSLTQFKGDIRRANLDGSEQEIVVQSDDPEFKPAAIALHLTAEPEDSMIYWTDYVFDVVRRAELHAGAGIEDLFFPPINHNPRGIALDLEVAGEEKVYWGQDTGIITDESNLNRMDLDGADPETVMMPVSCPQ
jgi:hypothetical protein